MRKSRTCEAGFTLVEVLAASSILALVIAIAMPLMLSAFRDRAALQIATDRTQSLRLAASLATQDARFATDCVRSQRDVQDASGNVISVDYVRLITARNGQPNVFVDYIFANKTGVVDTSNLHRLQGTGQRSNPVWERDDIAARDLVWSGDPSGGTSFGCESKREYKDVALQLVTVLDTKTDRRSYLDVLAYIRSH